jgi:uncharacterized protein YbjT (DUF2867 family)
MKIAIAGGTGTVGAHTVAAARAAGHKPVVLARSAGVDIVSGEGLDAALTEVDAVIDVTNMFSARAKSATQFFESGTRNLIEAGTARGVKHHVLLSIVGIDLVDYGYYVGKRAQEKAALDSGAPVSILRATQFHEFPGQVLDRVKGPIAIMPRMRVQTVAACEVGEALVALAASAAVERAPDLAGPEERQMTDLARLILDARRSKKQLWKVSIPGAAGKAMRSGALIPTGGTRGVLTFEQWLA